MIFYNGQRILCINDFFMSDDLPVGVTKPVEGMVYTVKNVVRSENDKDVYLVQLCEINKHIGLCAGFEGFELWRFRSIDRSKEFSKWAVDIINACTINKIFQMKEPDQVSEKDQSALVLDLFLIESIPYKEILANVLSGKGVFLEAEDNLLRISFNSPDGFALFLSSMQEVHRELWLLFVSTIAEHWQQVRTKNEHMPADVWLQYDEVLHLNNFRLK